MQRSPVGEDSDVFPNNEVTPECQQPCGKTAKSTCFPASFTPTKNNEDEIYSGLLFDILLLHRTGIMKKMERKPTFL